MNSTKNYQKKLKFNKTQTEIKIADHLFRDTVISMKRKSLWLSLF